MSVRVVVWQYKSSNFSIFPLVFYELSHSVAFSHAIPAKIRCIQHIHRKMLVYHWVSLLLLLLLLLLFLLLLSLLAGSCPQTVLVRVLAMNDFVAWDGVLIHSERYHIFWLHSILITLGIMFPKHIDLSKLLATTTSIMYLCFALHVFSACMCILSYES